MSSETYINSSECAGGPLSLVDGKPIRLRAYGPGPGGGARCELELFAFSNDVDYTRSFDAACR